MADWFYSDDDVWWLQMMWTSPHDEWVYWSEVRDRLRDLFGE